MVGSDQN